MSFKWEQYCSWFAMEAVTYHELGSIRVYRSALPLSLLEVSVHFIRFALLSLDLCCLNNCIWLRRAGNLPQSNRDNKLPDRTRRFLVGYPKLQRQVRGRAGGGGSSIHTAWRHSIKEITWIPTSNSMPTAGAAHSPIWLVCIHYTCTGTGHYHHSQDTSPPSPTPLLLVDRLGIECVYTYMYNVDNKYIYNQKGPYYILISESPPLHM